MKVDVHKVSGAVIRIGGPIVLAAIAQKLATGRLDAKAIAVDAIRQALDTGTLTTAVGGPSATDVASIRRMVLGVSQ